MDLNFRFQIFPPLEFLHSKDLPVPHFGQRKIPDVSDPEAGGAAYLRNHLSSEKLPSCSSTEIALTATNSPWFSEGIRKFASRLGGETVAYDTHACNA